ncbi:DEAD/DEAH family helicase [Williamsoniiplasma somnilux]|uniref:DEAD/DEAH family helicase n=1 Tax=Williamsoniiplasma somnilux TaxID=215578 RepID=A0A2K8NY19_9MOLU|nr:DEAD/DEAH box helicase family protein [Williamsoniiplasma somnilux]ATZ18719.1 DEAD/DEAH family helicase [Williamsoniiplasma somnilux]
MSIERNEFISKKLEAHLHLASEGAIEVKIVSPFISKLGTKFLKQIIENNSSIKKLKIITTTYDGTSKFLDLGALENLYNNFKNKNIIEIVIENSYQNNIERLHAKNMIFIKPNNLSVAFVGSSNVTDKGMNTGKETSVRIDEVFNPTVFHNANNYFDQLWNDRENFFSIEDREKLNLAMSKKERYEVQIKNSFLKRQQELTDTDFHSLQSKNESKKLYGYQQNAICKIFENIKNGNNKHLLVMATGTGKTFTIMSFIEQYYNNQDYHQNNDFPKVLFLAPRNEILESSIETLKYSLKNVNESYIFKFFSNYNKTEKYNGESFIFSTYQSTILNKDWISQQDFDLLIIDEVHHSEADGLKEIIERLANKTKHLIGLTATPERTDGFNISNYFDNKYVYEIGLHEAIDKGYLCDFNYYFINDETNIEGVDVINDTKELAKRLNNKERNKLILKTINEQIIPYTEEIKSVLFCINIEHANAIAEFLKSNDLKAECLSSQDNNTKRSEILDNFQKGKINFLCTVNILNEGIDIPSINSVIFLRPTQSFLIYLQQLGRGLRKFDNKILEIYDFVNNVDLNINKKYNPFLIQKAFFGDNNTALSAIKVALEKDQFNTIEKWMPGDSILHLSKLNKKTLLDKISEYGKLQSLDSILKNYQKGVLDYEKYKNFFKDTQLATYELYKKKKSLSKKNSNFSNFGSYDYDILLSFSIFNHKKIIIEFLKLLENKTHQKRFVVEMFISFFFTSRKEINKKSCSIQEALKEIFSKKELLNELIFLLNWKLESEILLENKIEDLYGTYINQLQMQVLIGTYIIGDNIEAKLIQRGIEIVNDSVFIKAREQNINTAFKHTNFYDWNTGVLHWESPDGWRINCEVKEYKTLIEQYKPIYVLCNSKNLYEKTGNPKYGIFLGKPKKIKIIKEEKKSNGNWNIFFELTMKN